MRLQALLVLGSVESAWAKDAEMALRVPDKAINAKKKKRSRKRSKKERRTE